MATDLRGDLLGATIAVNVVRRWALLLTPASAWALTLLVNYVLTSRACGPSLRPVLEGVAAIMLAVVALSAVAAWRLQARAGREGGDETPDAAATDRFMARLALMGCALFAVAIVAQAMTTLILQDCR